MTLSSFPSRVCPQMSHVTLRASVPLSIVKAFGLNIFQSLNTLIFIFFFFHPGSLGRETGEVLFTLN